MAFFGKLVRPSGSGGRQIEAVANCGSSGLVNLVQCAALTGGDTPPPLAPYGTGATVVDSPAPMQSLLSGGGTGGTATVTCLAAASGAAACSGISLGWAFIYNPVPGPPVPPSLFALAGNWVVRLHVTAVSDVNAWEWLDAWIVLLPGTGGTVQIGHAAGAGSMTAAGVYSVNVSGMPFGMGIGDTLVIMLGLKADIRGTLETLTFNSDQAVTSPLQWGPQNYVMGVELHPGSGSGSGATRPVVLAPRHCHYLLGKEIARSVVAASGSGSGSNRPLVEVQDCCPEFTPGSGSGTDVDDCILTNCAGGVAANQFSFALSGFVNTANCDNCPTILDGDYRLIYFVTCQWLSFAGGFCNGLLISYSITLTLHHGRNNVELTFTLERFGVTTEESVYDAPLSGWDCVSPLTLTRTFLAASPFCSGWPATITISPV